MQYAPQITQLNTSLHSPYEVVHPIKRQSHLPALALQLKLQVTNNNKLLFSNLTKYSMIMKLLLVATVLLVACMFTPSLAAPLQEEKDRAVLEVMISLASENHGHSEIQRLENAPASPPAASNPIW